MSSTSCQQRTATTSGEASLLGDFQETCTLHSVTGGMQSNIKYILIGLAGINLIEPGIACFSQAPQPCSGGTEG